MALPLPALRWLPGGVGPRAPGAGGGGVAPPRLAAIFSESDLDMWLPTLPVGDCGTPAFMGGMPGGGPGVIPRGPVPKDCPRVGVPGPLPNGGVRLPLSFPGSSDEPPTVPSRGPPPLALPDSGGPLRSRAGTPGGGIPAGGLPGGLPAGGGGATGSPVPALPSGGGVFVGKNPGRSGGGVRVPSLISCARLRPGGIPAGGGGGFPGGGLFGGTVGTGGFFSFFPGCNGSLLPGACFFILLLLKSPPTRRRRISNFRSSTIVITAALIISSMSRTTHIPTMDEKYQYRSAIL